ncbi:hypothetical protein ACWCPS_34405, partial [Streptomyces mauvecolor]
PTVISPVLTGMRRAAEGEPYTTAAYTRSVAPPQTPFAPQGRSSSNAGQAKSGPTSMTVHQPRMPA